MGNPVDFGIVAGNHVVHEASLPGRSLQVKVEKLEEHVYQSHDQREDYRIHAHSQLVSLLVVLCHLVQSYEHVTLEEDLRNRF